MIFREALHRVSLEKMMCELVRKTYCADLILFLSPSEVSGKDVKEEELRRKLRKDESMAQSPHIGDSDLAKRKGHKNMTKVHNKGSVDHKELARSFYILSWSI